MAISLPEIKRTTGKPNPLIYLYGPEKTGKTTLASEFEDPILVQTPGENPPAGIEMDTYGVITEFDTLIAIFERLYIDKHSHKTLIIDAIDGVERIIWAETCRRNSWASLEEPGYGRGYVEADAVWGEFLDGIGALREEKGMSVILIGHAEIKQFDDPANGSYSRFQPNLHKRAADVLKSASDIILFLNPRVSITKEKTGFGQEKKVAAGRGDRMMYLEARPGFVAGNRYRMPDEIAYKEGKGYAELAKYLPKVAA